MYYCVCCRAAQKVEDGVTQEIMKKFGDDKKMSKKEKDERFVFVFGGISFYLILYSDYFNFIVSVFRVLFFVVHLLNCVL